MATIIIPAHNEAAVIARGLEALLDTAEPGELEVIVACNGCTDATAEVARRFGAAVRVLETDTASKVAALNMADDAATRFPRFYVDADVVLPIEAVRRIVAALEQGEGAGVLAAAPAMRMDFTGASWAVRAYYRVWSRLPYTKAGFMGAGVYVLTETGRRRFDRFPDVVADDGYVRLLFAEHERRAVPDAASTVRAPATLADLVRIKTRSRYGIDELRQRYPALVARETAGKQYTSGLRNVMRDWRLWPCLPIYLFVALVSRWRARRGRARRSFTWERDESSRAVAPGEAVATPLRDRA